MMEVFFKFVRKYCCDLGCGSFTGTPIVGFNYLTNTIGFPEINISCLVIFNEVSFLVHVGSISINNSVIVIWLFLALRSIAPANLVPSQILSLILVLYTIPMILLCSGFHYEKLSL